MKHADHSKLTADFFKSRINPGDSRGGYRSQLLAEIYNEGLRFSLVYNARKNALAEVERKYASEKIAHCNKLFQEQDYYNLQLNLISLVEDAETLTTKGQSEFVAKLLYFRDHLRVLLTSQQYADFAGGRAAWGTIVDRMSELLQQDLGIKLDIKSSRPPRDFLKLENYIERAKWQYYKSRNRKQDFEKLVLYAQYDPRYLRAASMTTRKLRDPAAHES